MRGAMLPIVRDVAEPMGSVEQENPAINAAEDLPGGWVAGG